MAQLTDTLVSGDERVTGMIYGTQAGNYATCSTPAATAAKAVTIPGFVLTTGVHVRIKFSANNTAATPTLNVSETGAKAIKVKGNNLAAAGDLAANGIYEFVYDGTNWELTGAVCSKATTANYGYVQLATGDMNGQANVDGVAVSKNHTHSQYLPKAGGTMTGGITLPTNFYHKDSKFGIDAKNSDIINANSIYFGDECTDTQEGIHFKRGDSGNTDNYDTFWVDNGKICFVPNHAVSTATASSSAQIVPRFPSSISDNQVVLTNGTTGALKTSAASSLSVGTAADYNTSSGTIKTKFDELTIRAASSSSIYGFMFKKPLDGGSWYDGYGFSMMTFYGGSGHLYEIGVRLQGSTSSNPFPSGSRLAVTVIGDDELHVLGFNSNVWYKIVDNELQIIFLTPFTSTTNTTRIHMPGIVTRDKALTTSNSTILTASEWESATESVLVAAGWTHKDSSEVVFRRTLLSEGTTLPISKGGTAKTTRKAATNNLFSDIASATSNVTGESQLVFKYASPSDTNGIFYYRTASYLWSWLQTQLGYNSSSNKYGINISGTCALADQAYAFTEGVGNGSRPIYIDSNGFPQAVGMSTAHPTYLNLNVVSSYAAAHATDADTVDGVHMHIGYSAAESTVCFF